MEIIKFILGTLITLTMLGFIILPILIFRNNGVYKVRTRMIDERYELYKYLPSYNDMYYSLDPLNFEYWVKYCEEKRLEGKDEK